MIDKYGRTLSPDPLCSVVAEKLKKLICKDGTALKIDRGATVLDFAFYIHSEFGLPF